MEKGEHMEKIKELWALIKANKKASIIGAIVILVILAAIF